MPSTEIRVKLKKLGRGRTAKVLQRFFKTGPGEYGEGDVFLGIRVHQLRKLAKEYQDAELEVIEELLRSSIHEERLLALLILIRAYSSGDTRDKARLYRFYLRYTRYINNWDLVDASAEHIVGDFLMDKDKTPLYRLARSRSLWERRISIMATFHFIKHGGFSETLKIATLLLVDKEDLVHKAVGWMLREVGKRDLKVEEAFLRDHCKRMPRTMLRYAIERLPEFKRQKYLTGMI